MPGMYRGSGGCLAYMEGLGDAWHIWRVWGMPGIYRGSGGCLVYMEGLGDAHHIWRV